MRTGRPRSYDQRISVNTNIEADLYSFGKDDLKIPACEALTLGYIGRIDAELAVKKGVDPEDLERYLEIRNRAFRDLVLEQKKEEEIIQRVSSLAQSVKDEAKVNDTSEQKGRINWTRVPAEKFPAEYVRHLFTEPERAIWINELIEAYEDEEQDEESYASSDVLDRFVKEYFCRRNSDENKPSRMLSHNEVRNVLRTWADSLRGF